MLNLVKSNSLLHSLFFFLYFKWDSNHGPTNARLNKPAGGGKTGAWSAKANDIHQWIQVSFAEVTKVAAIGIQGRSDYDQWVTKFKVAYSNDGAHFTTQDKVSLFVRISKLQILHTMPD